MVSKQKEKFENIGITWSFQRRRFKHTDAADRIHLDFPSKFDFISASSSQNQTRRTGAKL